MSGLIAILQMANPCYMNGSIAVAARLVFCFFLSLEIALLFATSDDDVVGGRCLWIRGFGSMFDKCCRHFRLQSFGINTIRCRYGRKAAIRSSDRYPY